MRRCGKAWLRWILTAGLFLALGLVTSVAVAWGATVRHIALPSGSSWRARLIPQSTVMTTWGFKGPVVDDTPVYMHELRSGWPVHGLLYTSEGIDTRTHGFGRRYSGAIYGGLDVSRFGGGFVEYLPRQPIPLNLFLDTVFWGVIWLLFCTVGNVLRLKRWIGVRKKKRCGWCGYDLRDIPARRCPECGRVIERWPALFMHPARWPAIVILVILVAAELVFINSFISNRAVDPIHRAAFLGDLETVQAELARGTDIDLMLLDPWYPNSTPLLLAARNGHADVVAHLLDKGADPEVVSTYGNALTAAIRSRNNDLALRLIKAGVPISLGTGGGIRSRWSPRSKWTKPILSRR